MADGIVQNSPVTLRRHLFIAGTGRAGTSFLVRYLAELGLDTHVSRRGTNAVWDEHSSAGLEDAPFLTPERDPPYVCKSPWLYHLVDALLTDPTVRIDGVIIPVRDLAEAALSRSVVERRAIHQSSPWMAELDSSCEDWGYTQGGVVFSLNPVDQGRLLAVGFHHLVQRLVEADVPIVFLAFPKIVHDAGYVFEKLRPLLPEPVDLKTALVAHERAADPDKVRIDAEIGRAARSGGPGARPTVAYPAPSTLDAIALRRELVRLRGELAQLQTSRSWRFTRPLRKVMSLAIILKKWSLQGEVPKSVECR